VRSLLTNPVEGWGAILRAAGIERCAILVNEIVPEAEPLGVLAKAAPSQGKRAETLDGSGGVVAVARRKGSCRNWRSPPDPGEKDLGGR
jgi:hypothetical protein